MLIELDEYYNFASVTFDLEGQLQGQKGQRLIFLLKSPKSRLGSRKMYLLLQFSTEATILLHDDAVLVGAYGDSTEF